MKTAQIFSRYLVLILMISTLVFLDLYEDNSILRTINAQSNPIDTTTTNTTTTPKEIGDRAYPNTTNTAITNTTANIAAVNTSTEIVTSVSTGNITTNITTVTVVSYITLPPVTRPPSNTEIARWLSGGIIAGILIGLSMGYAFLAKGVSIKKQQTGGKGVKASEKMEKRKK
jgi:hypothetical protein